MAPTADPSPNPSGGTGADASTSNNANNIRADFLSLRSSNPHPIAHPAHHLTLTVYVAPAKIGSVIGRRGQAILNLQREAAQIADECQQRTNGGTSTSVRVSIGGSGGGTPPSSGKDGPVPHPARMAPSTASDGPSPHWAPVVVRSDPLGAFAAARLLVRDIGGMEHLDGNVVVDVPIARNRHATLVGRKGLTLMALSADHAVRIMVPHKRGGGGAPLAATHKQGGGGDERLFPGADGAKGGKGSDIRKGKDRGGRGRQNNDAGQDEENHAESHAQLPGHLPNRPANPAVVQLEGRLDDVERCLAKVLAIVAEGGNARSNNGGGRETAGDESEEDAAGGEGGGEKKNNRKTKTKTKKKMKEEGRAAKKAAEKAAPDNIPMDIEVRAKESAVAAAAAAAADASPNADKDGAADADAAGASTPKYLSAVLSATDGAAHLMPSSRKLQALAKSTGTKIRRRQAGGAPSSSGKTQKKDDEEGEGAADEEAADGDNNAEGEAEAEADDGPPGKKEIIITGRGTNVMAAINALEEIFGEDGCAYSLKNTTKKRRGKHQPRARKSKS